jgi:hypothetical protein
VGESSQVQKMKKHSTTSGWESSRREIPA